MVYVKWPWVFWKTATNKIFFLLLLLLMSAADLIETGFQKPFINYTVILALIHF